MPFFLLSIHNSLNFFFESERMMFLHCSSVPNFFSLQCAVQNASTLYRLSSGPIQFLNLKPSHFPRYHSNNILPNLTHYSRGRKLPSFAVSPESNSKPSPESGTDSNSKRKPRSRSKKTKAPEKEGENDTKIFPTTIPKKPRRGRRSEAAALEDYVRNSLEQTFASIQQQNAEAMENKEDVFKERVESDSSDEDDDDEDDEEKGEEEVNKSDRTRRKKKMVVEQEDPNWPLDADVGWGIRASEYFEKHPIKNVVGDDGVEIDWEGEIDDNWVKEINCLEWESFAFHPSPLVVLVFERYNRATDNWKTLKELEKALQVYWNAKDRLPPRAVKIDINIERDLAYALKVRECPQILFLRGNKILYREKGFRNADELVQMIAFFYYRAKKPLWIDDKALSRPF